MKYYSIEIDGLKWIIPAYKKPKVSYEKKITEEENENQRVRNELYELAVKNDKKNRQKIKKARQ